MANSLVSEQELFFSTAQPKQKDKFLVYVDGIPSYMVRKIARPSIAQEAKEIPHINVYRYIKGKTKWNPVQFTIYDFIAPSGAQALMEWQRLHNEAVTGRNGYADFYKKDVTLNVLGPVGDIVEQWIGKGCIITELNFGELDWSSDDLVEPTCTIQADYWILSY